MSKFIIAVAQNSEMSASVKPYRIKRPSTASKREHTKENMKLAAEIPLEGSMTSQTSIQRQSQPQASVELQPHPPQSFGSSSNINNSSRGRRLKSTNRLTTGSHAISNTQKSQPEVAVVFENQEEVMKALMERSRSINQWLLSGQLCMKMFRQIVRDCIFTGRSSSQSQYEYIAKVEDQVCRKIQVALLMRSNEKSYEERQVRIGSMIQERLKRLEGIMACSLTAK